VTIDLEPLRLAVYRSLAQTGRVPDNRALAELSGVPEGDIATGLRVLHDQHDLVLGSAGTIELAHPFGTRDFGFSVKSDRTLWWGGCVWDSFAIPNLVPDQSPVLVATTCPGCGSAHAWTVTNQAPPEGPQIAHFLVPVARMWDDVLYTCERQRVFCDERCLDDWLNREGVERGYVMSLQTAWRLASDWYTGRLDPGYRRREPAAATDYLRAAGLHGPFWGLPD
jgi:hypothetical protein